MKNILSSVIDRLIPAGARSLASLDADDTALLASLTAADAMDELSAYALVLVCAARIDGEFHAQEKKLVVQALMRRFSLTRSRAGMLLQKVEHLVDSLVSNGNALALIKTELSAEERKELLGTLKGVVAADAKCDPAELAFQRLVERLLA